MSALPGAHIAGSGKETSRDSRGISKMCLGVPGQLEEVFEEDGLTMGRVRFSGVARNVCLELIPGVQKGDFVLVHVGFALTRIDPAEAVRLLELTAELEEAMHDNDATGTDA